MGLNSMRRKQWIILLNKKKKSVFGAMDGSTNNIIRVIFNITNKIFDIILLIDQTTMELGKESNELYDMHVHKTVGKKLKALMKFSNIPL